MSFDQTRRPPLGSAKSATELPVGHSCRAITDGVADAVCKKGRARYPCPCAIDKNTEQRGASETAIPVVWPEGDIPVSHGKPGTASEVADVILFLASSKARHITGIPLWIDGGQGLLR